MHPSIARMTAFSSLGLLAPGAVAAQASDGWRIHEMSRPRPEVVAPAIAPMPARPPAGAEVLFDGSSLARWVGRDGKPAPWKVRDGYFEVLPGSGGIATVDSFGDVQLHLEWAEPTPPKGSSQDRGNSGVFLMGRYELQVLDSYQNDTYPDGQAGSIYGEYPPLYNVSLPPGSWQSYDVIFRRPRFSAQGALLSPARMTVFQNGVPVQNNAELLGPTTWLARLPYAPHPDRLPLELQDHGDLVRFRNIWIRRLPEGSPPPIRPISLALSDSARAAYTGHYSIRWTKASIGSSDGHLWLDLGDDGRMTLSADSTDAFSVDGLDASLVFTRGERGAITGFGMTVGGERFEFRRTDD